MSDRGINLLNNFIQIVQYLKRKNRSRREQDSVGRGGAAFLPPHRGTHSFCPAPPPPCCLCSRCSFIPPAVLCRRLLGPRSHSPRLLFSCSAVIRIIPPLQPAPPRCLHSCCSFIPPAVHFSCCSRFPSSSSCPCRTHHRPFSCSLVSVSTLPSTL